MFRRRGKMSRCPIAVCVSVASAVINSRRRGEGKTIFNSVATLKGALKTFTSLISTLHFPLKTTHSQKWAGFGC